MVENDNEDLEKGQTPFLKELMKNLGYRFDNIELLGNPSI